MNIVYGESFDMFKHRAIHAYGAKNLDYSSRKHKKYVVTLRNGGKIHFGDKRYEDFLIHKDKERRRNYMRRAKFNKNINGNPTDKNPLTANFWACHLLVYTHSVILAI